MPSTFFSESPEMQQAKKVLDEKQFKLANMQNAFQRGVQLIESLHQQIAKAQYNLYRIECDLAKQSKPDDYLDLQQQKKQCEDYIADTTERLLKPYHKRCEQWQQTIQMLQTEIENFSLTEWVKEHAKSSTSHSHK